MTTAYTRHLAQHPKHIPNSSRSTVVPPLSSRRTQPTPGHTQTLHSHTFTSKIKRSITKSTNFVILKFNGFHLLLHICNKLHVHIDSFSQDIITNRSCCLFPFYFPAIDFKYILNTEINLVVQEVQGESIRSLISTCEMCLVVCYKLLYHSSL